MRSIHIDVVFGPRRLPAILLLVVGLAATGCGASTNTTGLAEGAPTAASPEASSAEASLPGAAASDPAAAEAPPSARITGVIHGDEADPMKRVTIVFANETSRACSFRSYTLVQGGARKKVEGAFEVPARQTRERRLRVHPTDGELFALDPATATIELEVDCN